MPNDQLKRMVYRQDQILALPFPSAPSLARQIDNGVLKKEGAIRHDEAVQRDREAIQNILKAYLRWPKLEEFQALVTNVTNVTNNVTTIQTTVTQTSADLTAVLAAIAAQSVLISTLQSSVANLTAAINTLIAWQTPQRGSGFPDPVATPGRFDGDTYWKTNTVPPGSFRWDASISKWYSMA